MCTLPGVQTKRNLFFSMARCYVFHLRAAPIVGRDPLLFLSVPRPVLQVSSLLLPSGPLLKEELVHRQCWWPTIM